MVLYNIYSNEVQRSYRAHICSFATLFCFGLGLIVFITPIFIAYQSIGLWKKQEYYVEQPEINYKHDFLLLAQGKDPNSILGYSTFTRFNKLLGDSLRICTVLSREVDKNHDSKNEFLTLTVKIPLEESEEIHRIQLLLFFDYKLHQFSSLQMQSLANINHESALPGSSFSVEGELKLNQKIRLPNKGSFTKFNTSIVNATSNDLMLWKLEHIMSGYHERNVSTDFVARYPVWKPGQTHGQPFIIKVKVVYPEELVLYQPGFWQLIKFAWIQYLAILFIFLVIGGKIKRFVFENRLVRIFKPKVHLD